MLFHFSSSAAVWMAGVTTQHHRSRVGPTRKAATKRWSTLLMRIASYLVPLASWLLCSCSSRWSSHAPSGVPLSSRTSWSMTLVRSDGVWVPMCDRTWVHVLVYWRRYWFNAKPCTVASGSQSMNITYHPECVLCVRVTKSAIPDQMRHVWTKSASIYTCCFLVNTRRFNVIFHVNNPLKLMVKK